MDTESNEEELNNDEKKDSFSQKPFIFTAIGLFLIVLGIYTWYFRDFVISKDTGNWGAFGDFVGGTLNPMLAFLSLIAILTTIKYQTKELKASTRELSISSQALKDQANSFSKQNFENTFFNLINLHNTLLNSIIIVNNKFYTLGFDWDKWNFNEVNKKSNDLLKGKESVSFLQSLFLDYCFKFNTYPTYELSQDLNFDYKNNQLKRTNKLYLKFHEKYGHMIGHYFRSIYQILKYIKNSDVNDKKFYSNILRAQLSKDELEFLFYTCISDNGSDKFLPLLIEFEFLEPLPYSDDYSIHDIKFVIEKTIELNSEFEKNKIFGSNKNWKEFIDSI